MESEYAELIRKLKGNTVVAELADGTLYRCEKGISTEVLAEEYEKDEEFFMDAALAVDRLDAMGAFLAVHMNVWYVFADNISERATGILEDFGIEFEYGTKLPFIHMGKTARDGKTMSYEEFVMDTDDPGEAIEMFF